VADMGPWLSNLLILAACCYECRGEDSVIQPPGDVIATEGEQVTLDCQFDAVSSVNNLQWYRQYLRSKPEFLILITKSGYVQKPVPPRMSAQVQTDRMDLEISSAEVTDSALYYCALEPTVTGNPDTLYKNLSSALARNQ
uniref:Ig-like domain-containing protein n=1 Tax=Oncorhynchus kisutch TaxID=8019 RepID=A0A8C7HQ24_ONCKI